MPVIWAVDGHIPFVAVALRVVKATGQMGVINQSLTIGRAAAGYRCQRQTREKDRRERASGAVDFHVYSFLSGKVIPHRIGRRNRESPGIWRALIARHGGRG